jgi:hypothetical protein
MSCSPQVRHLPKQFIYLSGCVLAADRAMLLLPASKHVHMLRWKLVARMQLASVCMHVLLHACCIIRLLQVLVTVL